MWILDSDMWKETMEAIRLFLWAGTRGTCQIGEPRQCLPSLLWRLVHTWLQAGSVCPHLLHWQQWCLARLWRGYSIYQVNSKHRQAPANLGTHTVVKNASLCFACDGDCLQAVTSAFAFFLYVGALYPVKLLCKQALGKCLTRFRLYQEFLHSKGLQWIVSIICRAASLPEEYIPEIEAKLKPLNIKWSDFKITDNSCKPHPPPVNPLVAVSSILTISTTCLSLRLL